MSAIFRKEINSFFSGIIGYLVIGVFLTVNGLFLWVFKGDFNILDYGFSSLAPFFDIAPWIFIFLIPAITMRSFAEEFKQGTIEILLTQPTSKWKLILGKYWGYLCLALLALIPTLLYVLTIYKLGEKPGNFDLGEIWGAYIGLVFLAAVFTSIGLFCSSLTKNQIVSFIGSVLLCFLCFFAFDGLANTAILGSDYGIEYLGIRYHYESMGRGVLDTRDFIYFLSLIVFFLMLTRLNLNKISR